MIQRSSVVIDKNKSKSFVSFIKTNAKNEDFWKEVKRTASTSVNKEELEKMFKKES